MTRVMKTLENGLGRLTFAEPSKRNALDQDAWLSVPVVIDALVADGARVIILRGAGEHFCAGADISEFDTVRGDADSARTYEAANEAAFAAVRHCSVPTIAAIDGFCLGGGFGLAAACDIRLATNGAKFGVPAARLGLAYPVDAMADIVAALGEQNAKRVLFTGERFDAASMSAMGFISETIEADELASRAEAVARSIAALAPLTHSATKAAIAATRTGETAQADALGARTFDSADYAEGRAAFREKRSPHFKGN